MSSQDQRMFDLSGKVALVTGGARGLGEAIARAFADNGATTVICDLDLTAATAAVERISAETDVGELSAAECDVRDQQQVNACVANVLERFGRIDVLVNNAGIHRRVTPSDFDRRDIDAVFETNLLGTFFMTAAVGQAMVEQRSGSVINVSALGGGLVGLGRGGSIYGMTKGGIVSLTRDLAAEWGRYSVRVNALAPGWIRTPMTSALQQNERKSAKVIERIPLQRWGEPEDVAGPALFLASDASRYITGHTIPIDGGAANVITISDD